MVCLSYSWHKAGNANTLLCVLTMQELVLWGFSVGNETSACTALLYVYSHPLLHILKELPLASPILPLQCDFSEISQFTMAHQALGLTEYYLHWRREPDPKPGNFAVEHIESLSLNCSLHVPHHSLQYIILFCIFWLVGNFWCVIKSYFVIKGKCYVHVTTVFYYLSHWRLVNYLI